MAKSAMFSKFQTNKLEVLSSNYENAHLLSIGDIPAKYEEVTPCSYIYALDKIVEFCRY